MDNIVHKRRGHFSVPESTETFTDTHYIIRTGCK